MDIVIDFLAIIWHAESISYVFEAFAKRFNVLAFENFLVTMTLCEINENLIYLNVLI